MRRGDLSCRELSRLRVRDNGCHKLDDALSFSKVLQVHLQNFSRGVSWAHQAGGVFKRKFYGVGGVILDNRFLLPVHIPYMNSWASRISQQIDAFDEAITERRALDKCVFTGEWRYDSGAERNTHSLDRARKCRCMR